MTTKSKNYSVFLVTINTNMRTRHQDTQLLASFLRSTMNALFGAENVPTIIKFLNGKKQYGLIREVDVQYAIERGEGLKGSRLHSHALVRIWHDTRIHLDRTAIKEFVVKDMNVQLRAHGFKLLKSVYVNIRAQRGSEFNLLRYLEKTAKSGRKSASSHK